MTGLKKVAKFICSMKFALILLGILALVCVAGSVITQGNVESYYTSNYPEKIGWLILLLGLDDVFHSWWFAALTIILCLNLLGCNLLRFPRLIAQMKNFTSENYEKSWNGQYDAETISDPAPIFEKMGFHKVTDSVTAEGKSCKYAGRNRFGIWGAWLTHLGMLIIIIGFSLGQIYTVKYTVYGVPGQTKEVEGTSYTATIDSFEVGLRDDDTVTQYTSQVTITDTETGESQTGETSVNHPLNVFGMKVYQNSMGWAAKVTIVKDEEEIVQEGILCAGEYTQIGDVDSLYLMFNAFYPDYTTDADGNPMSATSELNNPGYLYSIYYQNQVIGMKVLTGTEMITVDNYAIIFSDPQQYSLIQLKRDPYTWIALIGALIIMAALMISFYLRTEELYAVQQEDGTWNFSAKSRKGGVLYLEKLQNAVKNVSNS